MCIIIYVPEGKKLPSEEILSNCWENNPHNGGFMYVHNYRIRIRKYEKKEDYIKAVTEYHQKYGATSPFVLHMRYNTQGGINLDNTHPFKINRTIAFVHNGVISQHGHSTAKTDEEKKMSDTRLFKHRILKKLPNHLLRNAVTQHFIEHYIGSSKIVFMFNDGWVDILNEEKGEWVDDVWFSNDYYKSKRKPVVGYITYSGSREYQYPLYLTTPNNVYTELEDKHSLCRVCGAKYEYNDSITVMIKFLTEGGFPHSHYTNVCHECFDAIFARLGLTPPDSSKCDLCNLTINNNTKWRNDVFCIDMSVVNLPKITIACGSCAHGKWKLNGGKECSYSSVDAQWLIDRETKDIKLASATTLINKLKKDESDIRKRLAERDLFDEDGIYFGM